MRMIRNPFVIGKYAGPEYFCDRVEETAQLSELLLNGNNVVLTSPRRIGKTDLIKHLFVQHEIKDEFITIKVDIYSTQNLGDFINQFGRQIKQPSVTLDEIFRYIASAPKPCLIAIDEFQQIINYPNGSQVEALLRTYIQDCNNAQFVFSGSQRHMMAEMFTSPARPFYQSARLMGLPLLKPEVYEQFCIQQFQNYGKVLSPGVASEVYQRFEGITSYMHQVMNQLFTLTPSGGTCEANLIDRAIEDIISTSSDAYTALLYQIPQRQRDLLYAVALDEKARNITSGDFIKRHSLPSSSSVSTSAGILLEKDLLSRTEDTYEIYDRFFAQWLRQKLSNF